jgi:hypothetical protein
LQFHLSCNSWLEIMICYSWTKKPRDTVAHCCQNRCLTCSKLKPLISGKIMTLSSSYMCHLLMFKICLQFTDTYIFQTLSLKFQQSWRNIRQSILNENLSETDFSDIFNQSNLNFFFNEEAMFFTELACTNCHWKRQHIESNFQSKISNPGSKKLCIHLWQTSSIGKWLSRHLSRRILSQVRTRRATTS